MKMGWPGKELKPGQPIGGPRSRRTMHGVKAEHSRAERNEERADRECENPTGPEPTSARRRSRPRSTPSLSGPSAWANRSRKCPLLTHTHLVGTSLGRVTEEMMGPALDGASLKPSLKSVGL
jgi:hypothetical protein